ncbi:MAG TPA: MBL fold metallo-hydrolase [Kofleriaceae bacterium]|nr:MBL fold metallo-hydrolase [Kofleriaceae bacterium]
MRSGAVSSSVALFLGPVAAFLVALHGGGCGDSGDDDGVGDAGAIADAAPGGSADAGSGADGGVTDRDAATASCRSAADTFPPAWIRGGPDCGAEEEIQVHRLDQDTFILRQSLCTSFEAPFLYLLFGQDRVLLEDTGDGGIPIADAVLAIIDQVLAERGQDSIELVVAHSHGHGDHTAGDEQFEGLPGVTVVGTSVSEVQDFFSIGSWPDDTSSIDLGGRVVDVVPIPGHQGADIALFDRAAGLLLTGDTLYPGRLYIGDFAEYRASVGRLVQFAGERDVCWVLGAHIEMTVTPGEDYAMGVTSHPDEHPLQLGMEHLVELGRALDDMGERPVLEVHDDFIVFPL